MLTFTQFSTLFSIFFHFWALFATFPPSFLRPNNLLLIPFSPRVAVLFCPYSNSMFLLLLPGNLSFIRDSWCGYQGTLLMSTHPFSPKPRGASGACQGDAVHVWKRKAAKSACFPSPHGFGEAEKSLLQLTVTCVCVSPVGTMEYKCCTLCHDEGVIVQTGKDTHGHRDTWTPRCPPLAPPWSQNGAEGIVWGHCVVAKPPGMALNSL